MVEDFFHARSRFSIIPLSQKLNKGLLAQSRDTQIRDSNFRLL